MSSEATGVNEPVGGTSGGHRDETDGSRLLTTAARALSEPGTDPNLIQEYTEEEIIGRTSYAIVGGPAPIELSPLHQISVSFSLPGSPEWLLELESEIEELGALEEDFDGEGGRRVAPSNIDVAKRIVRTLYEQREIRCIGAFPTSMGGVELEIESKFWEGSVVVEDPERVDYIVKIGKRVKSGKSHPEEIAEKISEALG